MQWAMPDRYSLSFNIKSCGAFLFFGLLPHYHGYFVVSDKQAFLKIRLWMHKLPERKSGIVHF